MEEGGACRDDRAVRQTYERRPEQPCSVAIVTAVADVLGCTPTEMPELLYKAVDADALDRLLMSEGESRSTAVSCTFHYCGYTVEVTAKERVMVSVVASDGDGGDR